MISRSHQFRSAWFLKEEKNVTQISLELLTSSHVVFIPAVCLPHSVPSPPLRLLLFLSSLALNIIFSAISYWPVEKSAFKRIESSLTVLHRQWGWRWGSPLYPSLPWYMVKTRLKWCADSLFAGRKIHVLYCFLSILKYLLLRVFLYW